VHVDSRVRRGRDYLQVLIVATAGAAGVAEALDLAWRAFGKAAGSDAAGWDMARHAAFPERVRVRGFPWSSGQLVSLLKP
jgi:hypothetical protein